MATARMLLVATTAATLLAASSAGAAELQGERLLGGDGDDAVTFTASDTSFTWAPGPTTTITRTSSFCTGGGSAGVPVVCPRWELREPLVFELGAGDDRLEVRGLVAGERTVIRGGVGDDELIAGDGDDTFHPGTGDDIVEGGGGTDRLTYQERDLMEPRAVRVDLQTGVAGALAGGERDILNGIEDVVGTTDDDVFLGDARDNTFIGYGGYDRVDGGPGNDLFWTGSGYGHADYSSRPGPLDITVADDPATRGYARITVTAADGTSEVDRFGRLGWVRGTSADDVMRASRPAGLVGGPGDDTITGSSGADALTGEDGDDHITAGDGDDVISGGAGDDVLDSRDGGPDQITCGDGVDLLFFDPNPTPYLVLDAIADDCESKPRPPVFEDPPYRPVVPPTPPFGASTPPGTGRPTTATATPPTLTLTRSVFRLRRAGLVRVTGSLTRDGVAVPRARVTLKQGRRSLARMTTNARGQFAGRLRVARSLRFVVAYVDGATGRTVTRTVRVTVTR